MSNNVHAMAVRLCEGGVVCVGGLCVRAKRVPDDVFACALCAMDSACNSEINLVCAECDVYDGHKHLLYIAK